MSKNPQRLAWAILLASFFVCVGVIVGTPLGVRQYVLHAQATQNVTLEVQQGPLRVTLAGRDVPIAVTEAYDDLLEGTVVATDATAGRLVIETAHAADSILAAVQLYNDTEVILSEARSPRFSASRQPHRVVLKVGAGRVRVSIPGQETRSTVVEVPTPHGTIFLTEGSYEVKVDRTGMEVTVREGRAELVNSSEPALSLAPDQRAAVEEGEVTGPLPATRNLITNGKFETSLAEGWVSYRKQDDPLGTVHIVTDDGRKAANFYRSGSGHGEVGIHQEIDYPVRDFTYLELRLAVNVISEHIAGFQGCGTLSSECPIIVRIDYKDIYGNDHEWLHGFYIGEPAEDWLLFPWTEQLPAKTWQTFESGNLMEQLADTPPARLKKLTVYASGHSFHAMVTQVELLAQE
jgi:hypothetical protein